MPMMLLPRLMVGRNMPCIVAAVTGNIFKDLNMSRKIGGKGREGEMKGVYRLNGY